MLGFLYQLFMYSVSEEVLVSGLKSKNAKAFAYLYDSFAPALLGNIRRLVSCPSSAEDVLQNVFIKIWSHADQYEPTKGRLFTWMVNISRNATIDYLRSQQIKPHEYGTVQLQDAAQKACVIDRSITRMDIRNMINTLPPRDRGLLELVMAGFTCKEIGKLLHLPESTVKTRLRAAYKKCRLGFGVASNPH